MMNRNVSTMEDKANLSATDGEGMITLSRLERDILLADATAVNEELESLSQSRNADYVMQILERDLQSVGIKCSWSKNAALSLQAEGNDLIYSAKLGNEVSSAADLQLVVGQALLLRMKRK